MGILNLTFFAQSIKKQSGMVVLFPDRIATSGPYPVLYLLHGLSDDHTMWTRMTSLERYARTLPLIIAMPDAGRSFYIDSPTGLPYEQYIVHDVIETVDRTFRTRADRSGRCIGGLSMGGYGAMKIALKHPHLFASVTSHSGAFYQKTAQLRQDHAAELSNVFGGSSIPDKDNVYLLSESAAGRVDLPQMRLDCGSEDFLLDANRFFHAHLSQLGIAHEYQEFPGGHQWPYWDLRIPEALEFHARHLGIQPEPLTYTVSQALSNQ